MVVHKKLIDNGNCFLLASRYGIFMKLLILVYFVQLDKKTSKLYIKYGKTDKLFV
jgi:hypothetical protein